MGSTAEQKEKDGRPKKRLQWCNAALPAVLLLALWGLLVLPPTVAAPVWTPGRSPLDPQPALLHPIAVFGEDARRPLSKARKSLASKIGLLSDRKSRSLCTAFCVTDRIIATAAHCLFRTKGEQPPRLDNFSFRLASSPSGPQTRIAGAMAGAAAQNVMSGTSSLSIKPPIDATSDWALVRLAAPVCTSGGLPLARATPDDLTKAKPKKPLYHVSFHADVAGWQLTEDSTCALSADLTKTDGAVARDFSAPDRLILHSCDTGGASSGSPLLVDGPHGPEVAGINVGTYVLSKVLLKEGEVIHRYRSENVANTAVSAIAFQAALAAFERAEILTSRTEILEMQKLLAREGHFSGRYDGLYGAESRQAIERFEKSLGEPVTGLATTGLLRQLSASRSTAKNGVPAEAPSVIETGTLGRMRPSGALDKSHSR